MKRTSIKEIQAPPAPVEVDDNESPPVPAAPAKSSLNAYDAASTPPPDSSTVLGDETSVLEAVPSPEASESSSTDASPRPEAVIEALLMAADAPLPGTKIAEILGTGTAADVREHVQRLNEDYERRGAAFRIEAIAKGYQVLTLPLYDRWISKLRKVRADSRLSAAALETLAVIAYKQPVMRADIEAVRGVAAGDILLRLREMRLIKIVGRAEEVGRPLLYGTTNTFLDTFGLGSLKDLPPIDADQPDAVPKLRVAREEEGVERDQPAELPSPSEP